jgi:hypothetical protein
MANISGKENISSNPASLIIIYTDGYSEVAKYSDTEKKFKEFKIITQDELEELKSIIGINKNTEQLMPRNIVSYKDINNFSFIIKRGWQNLKFSKFLNKETNEYEYKEISTYLPDLYVKVVHNELYFLVKKNNKLYKNPLPNNFSNGSFCIGSADKSFITEQVLSEKVELIIRMYIDSIFSHKVNHEVLDDWFNGKINYKKLEEL